MNPERALKLFLECVEKEREKVSCTASYYDTFSGETSISAINASKRLKQLDEAEAVLRGLVEGPGQARLPQPRWHVRGTLGFKNANTGDNVKVAYVDIIVEEYNQENAIKIARGTALKAVAVRDNAGILSWIRGPFLKEV